jgi:enoyl-CoA hydratase/carnithine racemase
MNLLSPLAQVGFVLDGSIANVTLERPQVGNALSASMVDGMNLALDQAAEAGARMIVLRGTGKHLCTGFDLSDLENCSDGDLLLRFVRVEQLLQKLYRSPVTSVALGSGRTYGAGADLFASCDRRIGLPDTKFAFPGSEFGLVLGSRRLAARIGNDAARRVLLKGDELGVEEAARLGLVTDICDEAALPGLLAEIATTASRLAPETVRALHDVTISRDDDADLAALVKSASLPGLKDRIVAYRSKVTAARKAG